MDSTIHSNSAQRGSAKFNRPCIPLPSPSPGSETDVSPSKLYTQLTRCAGLGCEFAGLSFEGNGCLDEIVGLGDIVSCATNSETPLVKGERLKDWAHLDLVGSFKHSMKECDDEAIRRGRVFVDNEAALNLVLLLLLVLLMIVLPQLLVLVIHLAKE